MGALALEPDVFHAPAVEGAIGHDGQSLDAWLPAGRLSCVIDDWPRPIHLQFFVDLPHQLFPLLLVGFHRFLVEELLNLAVAVARVVALRSTSVVLVKLLVGVVDPPGIKMKPI